MRMIHWVLLTIHQQDGNDSVLTVQGSRNPLEIFPAVLEEVTKDYHFNSNRPHWKEAIEKLRELASLVKR